MRSCLILVCAAAVALAVSVAVTQQEEVVELDNKPPSRKAHAMNRQAARDINPKRQGTGRFKRTANFPGAPYGLPGYKESHDWTTDVDYFMPISFNWRFYAAKYKIKGKTEAEVKADWLSNGLGGKAPSCRQGNDMFSLNAYFKNNPGVQTVTSSCKGLAGQYLRNGVFEGLSGAVGHQLTRQNKHKFPVSKTQHGIDLAESTKIKPTLQYTYTFWMKLSDTMSPQSNVLFFGDKDYPRSPGVFVKAGSTNLQFKASQSNDADFGCDVDGAASPGALALRKWHMIGLVVKTNGIAAYINGQKKCEKTNSGGNTLAPSQGAKLYLSSPYHPPARAEIRDLKYYADSTFTAEEIQANMLMGGKA